MKTYLTYGFYMALGNALLTFALYFMGFHSEASKFDTGETIRIPVGLVISITCIVLGIKARRTELPLTEDFGYGRALGTGFKITLFAALFGSVFGYVYFTVINPNFIEVIVQAQTEKLEAKGMSGEQIERVIGFTRGMMKPAIQTAFSFIIVTFFGTMISLIAAAFLKRPSADEIVAA